MKNLDFPINRDIAKPRCAGSTMPTWITIIQPLDGTLSRLGQVLLPSFTPLVQNADIVLEEPYWGGNLVDGTLLDQDRIMKGLRGAAIALATTANLIAAAIASGSTAERGKAVFQMIVQKYPEVQPIVWGIATASPQIALFIPEEEWGALSKEDQRSLAQYVKDLLPIFRASPDQYIDIPRDSPNYDTVRSKITHLCTECWMIGIGRLTLDGDGVLYDRVVWQGKPVEEAEEPSDQPVEVPQLPQSNNAGTFTRTRRTAANKQGEQSSKKPVKTERSTNQQPRAYRRTTTHPTPPKERYLRWAEKAKRVQISPPLGREQDTQNARRQLEHSQIPYNKHAFVKNAEKGQAETVSLFLTAGMSPNVKDIGGLTALMMASINGHVDVVRVLLNNHANVDARNNRGMTALMYAAWNGHPAVVQLLLERGANVAVKDKNGWTALRYARDKRVAFTKRNDRLVIAQLLHQAEARW